MYHLSAFLIVILILATLACSTPPPGPTSTPRPTLTQSPTSTPTTFPTATTIPATPTPAFTGNWVILQDPAVAGLRATRVHFTGQDLDLLVRCDDAEIDLFVYWSGLLPTGDILVTTELNHSESTRQTKLWKDSLDRRSMFYPGEQSEVRQFIRSLFGIDSLTIKVSMAAGIWDLEGIEGAVLPILEGC